jgi:hypothetical protein
MYNSYRIELYLTGPHKILNEVILVTTGLSIVGLFLLGGVVK